MSSTLSKSDPLLSAPFLVDRLLGRFEVALLREAVLPLVGRARRLAMIPHKYGFGFVQLAQYRVANQVLADDRTRLRAREIRQFVPLTLDEPFAASEVAEAQWRVIAVNRVEVKPLITASWAIQGRKVIRDPLGLRMKAITPVP